MTTGVSFRDAYGELPVSARALEIGSAVGIPWYSTEDGMREPALWWVRNVCGIFQLTPANSDSEGAGKTPVAKGGQWDETRRIRDEDQVYQMWAVRPWCNVGVATLANGFLVIDVDPRDGGNQSMRDLVEEAEVDLADVPRDTSPRQDGGVHLWWRLPAGAQVKTGTVLDGVDIPWQVPVAPSLRRVSTEVGAKGEQKIEYLPYHWTAGDPRELPEAPASLLNLLGKMGRIKGVKASRDVTIKGRSLVVTTDVDELLKTGIPHGMQNPTVRNLATSMARRNVPIEEAVDTLLKILAISPQDQRKPWGREDLYGSGTPGTWDWRPGLVYRQYEFIAGCKEEEAAEQKAWAESIRASFEASRRKGGPQ